MQIFLKDEEIKHKDITISGDINNFYQLFSYYRIITENNSGPLLEIFKRFYNNYKDLNYIYEIDIYFEIDSAYIFIAKNDKWARLELTDSYIFYDGDLANESSSGQTYWLNEVNFNYVINNLDKIELLT